MAPQPQREVYVHLEPRLGREHYVWRTICSTIAHGNAVVLITSAHEMDPPPSLLSRQGGHSPRFSIEQAHGLETERLLQFRKVYQPWGSSEPWERNNMVGPSNDEHSIP